MFQEVFAESKNSVFKNGILARTGKYMETAPAHIGSNSHREALLAYPY
jgi:hypothetical protein